jgi:decaprenylphospho-beta-D-erythro-pentofuranosid-2-ulose 2-reductase
MSASEKILILGATSAIAKALAIELASEGNRVILAGRDIQELEATAADLRLRFNANVYTERFDATDYDSHAGFVQRCIALGEVGLNGVVLCHGNLTDNAAATADFCMARDMIETNYLSAVSVLTPIAKYLESQRSGWICVLSSVAGDRGRQSNYIYGSAKAGLSTFLQGLRNRLFRSGVAVTTVKPGFVDTAMTWGLPGLFLVATPQKVARDIRRAIRNRRGTIYTPWFWRWIMMMIRYIPEPIFKRMKL